ncbi:hypothetical protein BDQ17DRAFT_1512218 [Cyathus striatus]|nr:hypothetical protein BDQ17DRAFT_1512218 [Cyathus striatus]
MSNNNPLQDDTLSFEVHTATDVHDPAPSDGKLGHGHCKRNNTRLKEFIEAEKMDEFGKPTIPNSCSMKKSHGTASHPDPSTALNNDLPELLSDSDGEDFDSDSDDESGSDEEGEEIRISNKELADALPLKLVSEKSKRKCAQSTGNPQSLNLPRPIPKKSHNVTISIQGSLDSIKAQTQGKCNPIYLFYEEVNCGKNGEMEEGSCYYQCYHGNRSILKMTTKKMKYSLNGLTGHLKKFPAMNRLYTVLNGRSSPPTKEEELLASAQTLFDGAQTFGDTVWHTHFWSQCKHFN